MRIDDSLCICLFVVSAMVCTIGDCLVELSWNSCLRKAICDNITHAIVGLLSALHFICLLNGHVAANEKLRLICGGFLLSSLIDIDHFIEARSFRLSVAIIVVHRLDVFVNCWQFSLPVFFDSTQRAYFAGRFCIAPQFHCCAWASYGSINVPLTHGGYFGFQLASLHWQRITRGMQHGEAIGSGRLDTQSRCHICCTFSSLR